MSIPTTDELETTRETLEWLLEDLEANESYVVNSIANLRRVVDEIPTDAEELER